MTDEPTRTRIHIGTFSEGLPSVLYFPAGSLKPAEEILDREREKRQADALRARIAPVREAMGRRRLKRALNACFKLGRWGR